ncbi:DNA mismatch repair protein MutL [Bacteroidia bacterium]|nr:DNA mismatch repair protein MutL [Bacteroidia bacterium]
MTNTIHVLPDNVANQIAAGEVVQRPASVVKELVENAVDAGATQIQVMIKDAGKYLVQVIDNGSGMSEVDVRLAFERHATSKITEVNDLFALHTFGFRGEALASIAAVAEVEVKTRRVDTDMGTQLLIRGSVVETQKSIACLAGTSIAVRNVLYNVPARRKFLKSNASEYRFIETELRRVALCHPEVGIAFYNNDKPVWELPISNAKQRVIKLFSSNHALKNGLLDLHTTTDVVDIQGFVIAPEAATKEKDKQYLFVNGRYFQSAYFRNAVVRAYEQLVDEGCEPAFFLHLTIDPTRVDVNIHPNKTEIKFENEPVIWQQLHAAVRATIGQYALAPTINFEGAQAINIPILQKNTAIKPPSITINPDYNPFTAKVMSDSERQKKEWRNVFHALPTDETHPFFAGQQEVIVPSKLNLEETQTQAFMQVGGKYVVTPTATGFVVIDQVRAHRRVLYEQILHHLKGNVEAQQELFPQTIALSPGDYELLLSLANDLRKTGLDISDFGNQTIVVQAIPAFANKKNSQQIVEDLLEVLHNEEKTPQQDQQQRLAATVAGASSITAGKVLSVAEMQELYTNLQACEQPDICPQGKPALKNIGIEEMDKWLKK